MYTPEQRARAVELCIRYGLKAAATIRELGYPSRAQLVAWYREWRDSAGTLAERSLGRYSEEQRRAAVNHYLEHGRRNACTGRGLGYPKSTQKHRGWVDELAPGKRRASGPRAFTLEEERKAVAAPVGRAGGARRIADEVGPTRRTPYKWKRELLPGKEPPMPDTSDAVPSGAPDAGAARPAPATQADIDALGARKAELERELRQLEPRRDVMGGAIEVLGKGAGADPADELTNRERTLLVESLRPKRGPCELLSALDMARSSHQCQPSAIAAGDRDAGAREMVCAVFDASDGAHGRRGTHDELEARGHAIGGRRMGRIVAEERLGARGRARPKRAYGSYRGEVSRHPGNKVRQDLAAGLPNFLWPADVTQLSIPAGRPCLGPVLDCLDGAVVSWAASASPDAKMANSMLRAALATTTDEERRHLVIHSDCGCHCRWPEWVSICEEAGIMRSMSRKGCSPDNSRMEGLFGTMEVETFHGRDWAGVTLDGLRERIDAYIERYNKTRVRRSPGPMSPLQYRQSLGLAAQQQGTEKRYRPRL
ncbi:IS3 family transposase, partial [Olsenella profusa]